MNRFKDLCSSSDSEEEVQRGSVQRGRVRQVKRFVEVKPKNSESQQTAEIIIPKKVKPEKEQIKPSKVQDTLLIQTNELKDTSSVSASQKFIREEVKPIQEQLQHFKQKIEGIKSERNKFFIALNTSSKDLEKVAKKSAQIVSSQLNKIKQNNSESKISQKVKPFTELSEKITQHIANLISEHQKTIQLITQTRTDMERTFEKVKYKFLEIKSMEIYNQEKETYEQFGVQEIYRILSEADSLIQELTNFTQ